MANALAGQVVAEILATNNKTAFAGQTVAEVLSSSASITNAEAAQIVAEILTSSAIINSKSAQIIAEVLTSLINAKAGQTVAEVLTTKTAIIKALTGQNIAEVLTTSKIILNAKAGQTVAEILTSDSGFPDARAGQNVSEILGSKSGLPNWPNPYSTVIKTAVYAGTINVPIAAVPWASPFAAISGFKDTTQFATFDDGNGQSFDASQNALVSNFAVATPTTPYLYEMNSGGSAVGAQNGLGPFHFNNYSWGISPPIWAQSKRSLKFFQELAAVASAPGPTAYGGAPLSQADLLYAYQTPMVTGPNPIPFWFNNDTYRYDGFGNRLIGPYLGYIRESLPGPDTALVLADMMPAGNVFTNPIWPFTNAPVQCDAAICKVPGTNSDFWLAGIANLKTCFKTTGTETGPLGFPVPRVSTFLFKEANPFAARIVLPLDMGSKDWIQGLQTAWLPHFQDPALDAIWMGVVLSYQIIATASGFLIILNNVNYRSFGNPNTFILVAPDWSSYKYINIMPQDAGSAKAIAETGSKLSAFIDLAGVFWLSTTNPHFFSSYNLFFPIPVTVPAAFGLPCFNPCTPLPIGVSTI